MIVEQRKISKETLLRVFFFVVLDSFRLLHEPAGGMNQSPHTFGTLPFNL
jgi:hypothetical protein